MYYKLYQLIHSKLTQLLKDCHVSSGTNNDETDKPAVFLTLLPKESKHNHYQKECQIKVIIQCISGKSFVEDLQLADKIMKMLNSIQGEERVFTSDGIETTYEHSVLSVTSTYSFTESLEPNENSTKEIMETLNMRQKF